MTLDCLKVGQKAVVAEIIGPRNVKRRLFDMGITPGVAIEISQKAPFDGPIVLSLRGYKLCIGKQEARTIWVEK